MTDTKLDVRARLRRRLKVGMSVASLSLALVVGEVVVRRVAPQAGVFTGDRLYVKDADTDYGLAPGPHAMGVAINAQGLRDVDRPVEKPAGTRRVLVLGDSFTFGAVPFEQGFPRQLAGLLPGVDVVNAGVPGWTTWQQAAWLRRDGLRYGPDVVVVALFVGNDIEENAAPRRLRVVDGELVEEDGRSERSWLRNTMNSSHLYRLLKQAPGEVWGKVTGDPPRRRWYHKIERRRLALCESPPPPALEEGWANTRARLAEIVALARPAPVVVLVIPDEFQVSRALLDEVCARHGLDAAAFDLDRPQRRLEAACRELGVARVDPLEPMRRRTAAGETLYLPLDSHWNAAGNRLAAEALAGVACIASLARP